MAQLQTQQRPNSVRHPYPQAAGGSAAAVAAARWQRREAQQRQLAGASCLQHPHSQQQQQQTAAASLPSPWHASPWVWQPGSGVGQRQRRRRRLQPCSALPRIASLETEPATADRVPQYKMPKGVRLGAALGPAAQVMHAPAKSRGAAAVAEPGRHAAAAALLPRTSRLRSRTPCPAPLQMQPMSEFGYSRAFAEK